MVTTTQHTKTGNNVLNSCTPRVCLFSLLPCLPLPPFVHNLEQCSYFFAASFPVNVKLKVMTLMGCYTTVSTKLMLLVLYVVLWRQDARWANSWGLTGHTRSHILNCNISIKFTTFWSDSFSYLHFLVLYDLFLHNSEECNALICFMGFQFCAQILLLVFLALDIQCRYLSVFFFHVVDKIWVDLGSFGFLPSTSIGTAFSDKLWLLILFSRAVGSLGLCTEGNKELWAWLLHNSSSIKNLASEMLPVSQTDINPVKLSAGGENGAVMNWLSFSVATKQWEDVCIGWL